MSLIDRLWRMRADGRARTSKHAARSSYRARHEQLEDRRLLAITVITHGLSPTFPAWVYDTAAAINERLGYPVSASDNAIERSRVRYDTADLSPPSGGYDHLLLFDWAAVSLTSGIADDDPVAGMLARLVQNRLDDSQPVDLHFIGHSRGAYVNNEAIRRLGDDPRIGVLQMTTLDSQDLGFDGTLQVWQQVDWADNYYQTNDIVGGFALDGALNVNLTNVLNDWPGRAADFFSNGNHAEVHDWYHWTIDSNELDNRHGRWDAELPPADRPLLYDTSRFENVDFNGDGLPDDWAAGARAGFYHSLSGGGIGVVVHDSQKLFTVDPRDGSIPLYLGQVQPELFDVAFDPAGHLFGIDVDRILYRIAVRFGAQNQPVITTQQIGDTGVAHDLNALEFDERGTLFAAGQNNVYRVDTSTGLATLALTLPGSLQSAGDLAIDPAGNLYLTTQSGVLVRIDPGLSFGTPLGDTGFPDLFGLSYIDGALYGFREAKEIYRISTIDAATMLVAMIPDAHVGGIYGAASLRGLRLFNEDRIIVTGAGPAGLPLVRSFDASVGDRLGFFAYSPFFRGGVRVALGDINGDGTPDIITGAGPGGGPHVRVFDGVTGAPLPGPVGSFFAYHPNFSGGLFVASGDVNGDGRDDIITGADAGGGPHVRAFSGVDGAELFGFYAYHPNFGGGVTVAVGDVNGDGRADVITGAGPGGGPHVRVFSGLTRAELFGFYAYHPNFGGGVFVAAGDVNGDGRADVYTGAGSGGGPHVRVISGSNRAELHSFFAYDAAFGGGVRVAAGDLDRDGRADIITGAGPGGGPHVRGLSGVNRVELASFFAYDATFSGGVYVASAPLRASAPALQSAVDAPAAAINRRLRSTSVEISSPADAEFPLLPPVHAISLQEFGHLLGQEDDIAAAVADVLEFDLDLSLSLLPSSHILDDLYAELSV